MSKSEKTLINEIEKEIQAFNNGAEIPSRVHKVETMPDGTKKRVKVKDELVKQVATLKSCRAKLELNQKDFAKLLGVGFSTYCRYEQHAQNIPLTVQKLASIYAVMPTLNQSAQIIIPASCSESMV